MSLWLKALGAGAGAVFGGLFLLWMVSVKRQDASLIDRVWGLGFVVLGVVAAFFPEQLHWRAWLMLAVVSVWGLRLTIHLTARNWGHGEDKRYQAMRRRTGESFWWRSLYIVFALQGVLVIIIGLPIVVTVVNGGPESVTVFDIIGCSLWLIGFSFEAIGDWQLTRFRGNPDNRGKVLNSGLWRYTRHPNYFGDALLWWGFYGIAASLQTGRWMFFSALIMTVLLLKVSGVALLEKGLVKSRDGYEGYKQRTSSFIPWWPKDEEL